MCNQNTQDYQIAVCTYYSV